MALKRIQEYLDRMEVRRIERNRVVREKYHQNKKDGKCQECGKPDTFGSIYCDDCKHRRLMRTVK